MMNKHCIKQSNEHELAQPLVKKFLSPTHWIKDDIKAVIVSDDGRANLKEQENYEPGAIYKNNKTGKLYRVIMFMHNCPNAQDGQEMVVYESIENPTDGATFCREVTEFREKFEAM